MDIHIINILLPEVFQRYSKKYNIFRDLFDHSLSALEIRRINNSLADELHKIVLNKKEISYKIPSDVNGYSNVLIYGNSASFKELSREIVSFGNEDLGHKISNVLRNYIQYNEQNFFIADKEYSLQQSYVMGILNVTPDSFSDGGLYANVDDAVDHAISMIEEGADIIDVGGESTRPGAEQVTTDEEIRRVIPVIESILKKKKDVIISVDTMKSEVAKQALTSGAKLINDVSSFSFDPSLLDVVKTFNAGIILMHLKGTPKDMQINPVYEDVVSEVYDYLNKKLMQARKAGIKTVIVDPGIGFGKRISDNYELIRRLEEFKGLGAPILIGISRKSFIGKTLELNINERDTASVIAESTAIYNGARIIRTHNVKNAVQSKKILKEILNSCKTITSAG